MRNINIKSLALLALTCVILPPFMLAGCGNDRPPQNNSTQQTTTAEPSKDETTTVPQETETTTVADTTETPVEVVKSDFEIYQSNSITPSSCNYALKSTDMTVTEIALDCGFNDVSHFIRVFRETYGVTPKKFRQTEDTER